MARAKRLFVAAGCAAALFTGSQLHGIEVQWSSPDLDRWHYPHLGGGTRNNGSAFSSVGQGPGFDDRMAQVLLGFDTAGQGVPTGLAAGQYQIASVTLTATVYRDSAALYDATYDAVATYTSTPDTDPGRSIELYGLGFRGGYTGLQFGPPDAATPGYSESETGLNSGFGATTGPGERYVFAADVATGALRDVSNNVTQNFDTAPFAVGQSALNPGDPVLAGTTFTFDVDVSDPLILAYLQSGLSAGELGFAISALNAGTSGPGGFNYVDFFMRESTAFFQSAAPVTLSVEYSIGTAAGASMPEPSSAALLGCAALSALLPRRRRAS